ncbi:MAG: hypothetical protein ACRDSP_23945 [Pseudonocardiaceae bacterium]
MSEPDRAASAGYLAVLAALTVVAITLVVFGTIFGWHLAQASAVQTRREVVLQAARQAAVSLTDIDYRTADHDVQRMREGSTADFATGFGIGSPEFLNLVKQTHLVSTGHVTSAGVERMDEHSARVLVAVTASVRDVGTPQGAPRAYRLGVQLVHKPDRWLVSKVEFIL